MIDGKPESWPRPLLRVCATGGSETTVLNHHYRAHNPCRWKVQGRLAKKKKIQEVSMKNFYPASDDRVGGSY